MYPTQLLMRYMGEKFTWKVAGEESFQRKNKNIVKLRCWGCQRKKAFTFLMRLYKRIGSRNFGDAASGTRGEWQDCLETDSIWEQSVKRYGVDAGSPQSADICGGDIFGKVQGISEHRSTHVTPG